MFGTALVVTQSVTLITDSATAHAAETQTRELRARGRGSPLRGVDLSD
jgi:hypothetical protein